MAHSHSHTPETAFNNGIRHFGYFLLRITLVLLLIILCVNLYFNKPFLKSIPCNLLLTTGLLTMVIIVHLSFSPFANALACSDIFACQVLAIMAFLFLHLVTADCLKLAFFKWIERIKPANAQGKIIQHLMFCL